MCLQTAQRSSHAGSFKGTSQRKRMRLGQCGVGRRMPKDASLDTEKENLLKLGMLSRKEMMFAPANHQLHLKKLPRAPRSTDSPPALGPAGAAARFPMTPHSFSLAPRPYEGYGSKWVRVCVCVCFFFAGCPFLGVGLKGSPKETNCWELHCSETNPNGPLSVRVLKRKKNKR